MPGLSFLCLFCIWVIWAAAYDFSVYLNGEGFCTNQLSIDVQDNNRTWSITKCEEPLPLNPAANLEQITKLTLEYNDISWLTKKQFYSLSSVKHLRLFENNVQQMNGNSLDGLNALTNLTIIEPHLAIEELHLSKECKLQHLNLRLQIFDSELLSKLPKDITIITIEDTPVINGEISIPDHLVNLKYLRLKNCSVASIKGPNVALSALEYLDLSHNKIEAKTCTWQKYPNLMTLILSYNKITTIEEKDFRELKSLSVLLLDNNNMMNVDLNAFTSNLDLTKVDLSFNNLKRIELNYTKFYNYRVQADCNPMLTAFKPETIFYSNTTNLIDCVPKESDSWVIVAFLTFFIIIILIILSCCINGWIKRESISTRLNETQEELAQNEIHLLQDNQP